MGKAKRSKDRKDLYCDDSQRKNDKKAVTSELESNLSSLDENNRIKACDALNDMFQVNISNGVFLDSVASLNILSKLAMRLIDSSERVRVAAASALYSLAESKDVKIITRICDIGIAKTVVGLVAQQECFDVLGGAYSVQLMGIVASSVETNKSTASGIFGDLFLQFVTVIVGKLRNLPSVNVAFAITSLLTVLIADNLLSSVQLTEIVEVTWKVAAAAVSTDHSAQGSEQELLHIQCLELLASTLPAIISADDDALVSRARIPEVIATLHGLLRNIALSSDSLMEVDSSDVKEAKASSGNAHAKIKLICSTVNTLLLPFAASEGKKSTPLHTNLRLQTHSLLFPAAGASSMISGLERVLGLLHEHLPLRRNGSGSDVVVTAEDIGFLEGVEHILTAVQGVVAFDALVAPHPLDCGLWCGKVAEVQALALDVVTNTMSKSGTGDALASGWGIDAGVDQRGMLSAATLLLQSGFDLMEVLRQRSCNADEVAKVIVLAAIRALQNVLMEIAVPAVQYASHLGGGESGKGGLTAPLHFVLTNALLRRLEESYAVSTEHMHGSAEHSRLLLMDACFNALIDIHSSDDEAYLQHYRKLQCSDKLAKQYQEFRKHMAGKRAQFSTEEWEQLEETAENVMAFVQYKSSFLH